MDIRNMLLKKLKDEGCKFTVSEGIVRVDTPDGEHWDFTCPWKIGPKREATEFVNADLIKNFPEEVGETGGVG